ncbi:MAG TPA: class I SAM-dependent methyltransferase [Actinocrinis sp.]|nr:class I SAM-dependent methyltransferase [Actinocrinis sp.]
MAGDDPQGDDLAAAQRRHWQDTYRRHPGMYGAQPSEPAVHAAELFAASGANRVLELGCGHGRDALHFARCGFTVTGADFSTEVVRQMLDAAGAAGLGDRVGALVHDAREPLPLPDDSVDAVFAHMLLCMALSTPQLEALVAEVRRVLVPGGVFVYTVRHSGDAHYGAGIARGDDIYEHGGFAVRFFTRGMVDRLADGWELREVASFEEGELPRRLWRVTQTTPSAPQGGKLKSM